jgi:hypothetical protein
MSNKKLNSLMIRYEYETGLEAYDIDYDAGCWVVSGIYTSWLEMLVLKLELEQIPVNGDAYKFQTEYHGEFNNNG